jgi:hypothetical protein
MGHHRPTTIGIPTKLHLHASRKHVRFITHDYHFASILKPSGRFFYAVPTVPRPICPKHPFAPLVHCQWRKPSSETHPILQYLHLPSTISAAKHTHHVCRIGDSVTSPQSPAIMAFLLRCGYHYTHVSLLLSSLCPYRVSTHSYHFSNEVR